jgi:hypothetical protein
MQATTGEGSRVYSDGKQSSGKKLATKRLEQSKGGHVHAPYGKALEVEETYTYENPLNGDGEPQSAMEHNPFYMAPGMAVGYRPRDLWGKGTRKNPQPPAPADRERMWGDPQSEDEWYR